MTHGYTLAGQVPAVHLTACQEADNNFDDSHVIMLIKTLQALLFTEMETMDQWRSSSSCLVSLSYPISYQMSYLMSYMIFDAIFCQQGLLNEFDRDMADVITSSEFLVKRFVEQHSFTATAIDDLIKTFSKVLNSTQTRLIRTCPSACRRGDLEIISMRVEGDGAGIRSYCGHGYHRRG